MRKVLTLFVFLILLFVYFNRENFSTYTLYKLLDLSIDVSGPEPQSDITVPTSSSTQIDSVNQTSAVVSESTTTASNTVDSTTSATLKQILQPLHC